MKINKRRRSRVDLSIPDFEAKSTIARNETDEQPSTTQLYSSVRLRPRRQLRWAPKASVPSLVEDDTHLFVFTVHGVIVREAIRRLPRVEHD